MGDPIGAFARLISHLVYAAFVLVIVGVVVVSVFSFFGDLKKKR